MLAFPETRLQTDWQGSSNTPSTPPLHLTQRSHDRSETEAEISLETEKQLYDPQKHQINTLDRRTQTTIFRLHIGHCGLRKHLKRLGLADSAHAALRSKLLSTFFRPAHTWRQYANSFGQKTLKWAPSCGDQLPNYSGRRTS